MRTRRGCEGAFLLAWGLLWAVGGAVVAADPPPADAALDRKLYDALKEMHNRAADVFNAGDPNGCYHMFLGGLSMARPLLAHRPELQQVIDQGMQNAQQQPSIRQRAHVLHDTIETVRTRLKPSAAVKSPEPPKADTATPPAASSPGATSPGANPGGTSGTPQTPARPMSTSPGGPELPPSPPPLSPSPPLGGAAADKLWNRLGGEAGVTAIVDKWLILTEDDPTINFSRGNRHRLDKKKREELIQKMVEYISFLSGGNVVYTGRDMAEAHKGMDIKPEEFKLFVDSLRSALQLQKVPEKAAQELIDKVRATQKDIVGK